MEPLIVPPQRSPADDRSHRPAWWERYARQRTGRSKHPTSRRKRFLDLALVILALPVALPVMTVCALAIALKSPGAPVLFRQSRTGRGGRPFTMLKFRTMVPDADRRKKELAHLNELQWPDFKVSNDPRVTRMGRWMRRTSLDELPQLFNILRGDMSFVGPRPTSFAAHTYELWQTERLDVPPGLTGLWQVEGRGEIEFEERVRLDAAYVGRACLALDLDILVRTVVAVVQHRGAK